MNAVDIFLEIVQVDSESFSEQRMSEWIQNFLKERNVNFEVDILNQIYARIEFGNEPILFCAHMDTVSPGKNIQPVVENGIIKSSGSTILGADNKSSLAQILWLIDYVIKHPDEKFHTLEFVFTVQEEVVPSGASQLNFDWFKSRVGFVFDSAGKPLNTVISGAVFINDLEVEFFGKNAHCSTPEIGQNSLLLMNEFLNNLELGKPYAGSTLNFGVIKGGDSTNTVPGYLKLAGDYRAESQETMGKILNDLESARVRSTEKHSGEIKINPIFYCSGYKHSLQNDNFFRLEIVYKNIGFENLDQVESQGGSDASALNNSGKGMEVFCLADGANETHSAGENISVENMEKLSEIVLEIAQNY